MKKLDAFQLKLFMALLMVLDHLDHIPGLLSPMWSGVFHAMTRCVSVWFAYMAVEGFIHTSNRVKYNLRLFGWAGIMYAGNTVLNYLYQSNPDISVHNNIFFTLALGMLILNIGYSTIRGSERWTAKKQKIIRAGRITLGVIIGVTSFCLSAEGALVVIPFMVICYALRDKTKVRNIALLCLALPLILLSYQPYGDWYTTISMMLFNCDGLFITVIPFMYLYNGERGLNNRFAKYFFYVFYPAHLWIITTIAYFVE